MSGDERRERAFRRFRRVVAYAVENNAFYRDFYSRHGFTLDELSGFDDIARVPVVQKDDLRRFALEERSSPHPSRMRVNTGGTSGQPLEFYLDADAFAREWAHMHTVWERIGYRQTDVKLTFRGKNLGKSVLRYNPVHNEYLVSAYHAPEDVCAAIEGIAKHRSIRFLHGYPSAIYEFTRYSEALAPDLLDRLRRSLQGILFGSEFPAPAYRSRIEKVFPVPTISWYGHSEMAVLAYERDEKFSYVPFYTYGMAEAVPYEDGYRLVGTSYDNVASPFIRYDTGDLIEPTLRDGLLESFRVAAGRSGDFIIDRNGNRVSLTAFVFGRHHEIFGRARFVQVCQRHPGEATIRVAAEPAARVQLDHDLHRLFDTSNIAVDFRFEVRDEPVRTAAGKVPLLVPADVL